MTTVHSEIQLSFRLAKFQLPDSITRHRQIVIF